MNSETNFDRIERLLVELGAYDRPPAMSPDDVDLAVGRRLPDLLRWLIAQFGGCRFADAVFYFDPKYRIDIMLGWFLNCEEIVDALDVWSGILAEDLVPIANDGGDNLLLVEAGGSGLAAVHFKQHDKPEPPYLVSPSLEAFLCSLHHEQSQ